MVEVASVFDRRVEELIKNWKEFLFQGLIEGNDFSLKIDDEVQKQMLVRLESTLTALKLRSMDLTSKKDKKQKAEEDDDYSPEGARAFFVQDRATKLAKQIDGQESPGAQACWKSLRSAKGAMCSKDGMSRGSGEGSDNKNK